MPKLELLTNSEAAKGFEDCQRDVQWTRGFVEYLYQNAPRSEANKRPGAIFPFIDRVRWLFDDTEVLNNPLLIWKIDECQTDIFRLAVYYFLAQMVEMTIFQLSTNLTKTLPRINEIIFAQFHLNKLSDDHFWNFTHHTQDRNSFVSVPFVDSSLILSETYEQSVIIFAHELSHGLVDKLFKVEDSHFYGGKDTLFVVVHEAIAMTVEFLIKRKILTKIKKRTLKGETTTTSDRFVPLLDKARRMAKPGDVYYEAGQLALALAKNGWEVHDIPFLVEKIHTEIGADVLSVVKIGSEKYDEIYEKLQEWEPEKPGKAGRLFKRFSAETDAKNNIDLRDMLLKQIFAQGYLGVKR
jgi:hypothetical protein